MKYQINKRVKDNNFDFEINPLEYFLYNNGIDNPIEYLQFNKEHSYSLLHNITKGVSLIDKHITKNKTSKIAILTDSDYDGFSSSSIIYKYLKEVIEDSNRLYSIVRTGKKHGVNTEVLEYIEHNEINLLIVPDAQVEYIEGQKIINYLECDILVLDHHETNYDIDKKYLDSFVIINPNYILDTTYPNKSLSGCAVTYKFIQALDKHYSTSLSSSFLDLVGTSIIADSMSMKIPENRLLVTQALDNISNKGIQGLIKANSYKLGGRKLTPHDFSFNIAPMVNAMVRVGDEDGTKTLFKAFSEEYEEFPYKKRGETEEVLEDVYTRAARLCTNARGKQSRARDKDMIIIDNAIENDNLYENKIIVVNTDGQVTKGLAGLSAIRIANKYQRPVLILTPYKDNILGGSARNCDNSYVSDLKQYFNDTELFVLAEGHPNSCGVQIKQENVPLLLEKMNKDFETISEEKTYIIDEVLQYDDISYNVELFNTLDGFTSYICNDIKKSFYLIENIKINASKIIVGKKFDYWKQDGDDNETSIFVWGSSEEDEIIQCSSSMEETIFTINAIATLGMNDFNGIIVPQLTICEYEIISKTDSEDIDDELWDETVTANKELDDWFS